MKSPPRHSVRRVVFFVNAAVFLLLVTISAMIWNRGRLERSRVEALLRFEGGMEAQLSEYEFVPSWDRTVSEPGSDGTTTLRLIIGRSGQHVLGYHLKEEPKGALFCSVPLFGEFCFADVTKIYIADERFSDSDIDLLIEFSELRELEIWYSGLTDQGLARLSELKKLVKLTPAGDHVTTSGLAELSRCKNLRELDLLYIGLDVGEQTFADLKKSLPDCVIRHR